MESKNQIKKKYNKLMKDVETKEFYKVDTENRVNCYTCNACGQITKTRDVDPGVTPYMHACGNCGEAARSSLYNDIAPYIEPTQEWYRPTLEQLLKRRNEQWLIDHVMNGGLDCRDICHKVEEQDREQESEILSAGISYAEEALKHGSYRDYFDKRKYRSLLDAHSAGDYIEVNHITTESGDVSVPSRHGVELLNHENGDRTIYMFQHGSLSRMVNEEDDKEIFNSALQLISEEPIHLENNSIQPVEEGLEPNPKMRELIMMRAIEEFGIHRQMDQMVEECRELIFAIMKFKRTDYPLEDKVMMWDLKEEIADVLVVAEQMKMMFNENEIENIIDQKLERLQNRFENNS